MGLQPYTAGPMCNKPTLGAVEDDIMERVEYADQLLRAERREEERIERAETRLEADLAADTKPNLAADRLD